MLSTDITVVGAGLAGATCAALLAEKGFKVCIINNRDFASWRAHNAIKRVSSFNQASARIFKHLNIWKNIKDYACPFSAIQVWQQYDQQHIEFESKSQGYPAFAYIIENDLVTSQIIEKLRNIKNVQLFENTQIRTVEDNQQLIVLNNGQKIKTQLIIGADGIHSQVRRIAAIDIERLDYAQRAIVCNIKLDGIHAKERNTAWQSFLETGPLALLPLYNGEYSIVWSCTKDKYNTLTDYSDEDFKQVLSDIISPYLPSVKRVSHRYTFPITHQHAKKYFSGNIRLIGDAAHTTHPLAGIGANLGILDAAALAQMLNQAKTQHQDINKASIAARYQRWRRSENILALKTMQAFNNSFTNSSIAAHKLSGIALNIANHSDYLKTWFGDIAMGNIGDLPDVCRPPY